MKVVDEIFFPVFEGMIALWLVRTAELMDHESFLEQDVFDMLEKVAQSVILYY